MASAGEGTTLLDRRRQPSLAVKIAKPIRPKLKLDIPPPSGCVAEFVTTIHRNPNPVLEDGVVNTGSFDNDPDETDEERRERCILELQTSGDVGRNHYLHWYTEHPNMLPREHNDECPCQLEAKNERWIDYGDAVKLLVIVTSVNVWWFLNAASL